MFARVPAVALAAAAALMALVGCAATSPRAAGPVAAPVSPADLPFGDAARRERRATLVLDGITDTRSGVVLSPEELAQRLAGARLVFVGESHTHLESHLAQARLVEALAATGRPLVIGLEMFPRDDAVAQALRRWTDGASDEATFLRESRWYEHWGFNFGYYRPLFEAARRHHATMVGVNAPRAVITAVRKRGFDGLTAEERAHLPPRVDTSSDEHRRMFAAFLGEGAHGGGAHGGGGAMPDAALDGMFRAQCTWDAVMAWNAARALEAAAQPNAVVVVMLGAGHVAFGLGAPRQAVAAGVASEAIASVITVAADDEAERGAPARVRASYADYLWTVPPEPPLPLFPSLGVSVTEQAGAQHPAVAMVSPASAAAAAGVRAGDLLAAIDGVAVPDQETLSRLIADKRWGDVVRISVLRGGATLQLVAPLRRAWPLRP